MITQHATPPKFGTTPIEEGDDLFLLQGQTCADCGNAFLTSQPASRCALCAALRSGQVGPATVLCSICGIEYQVPVLAPHKLCGVCAADLPLAASNIAADLQKAENAWNNAALFLNEALEDATEADRRRFDVAVAARETGKVAGRTYSAAQLAGSWARALVAGDGLSPLLAAHNALKEAAAAMKRTAEWAEQARADLRAAGRRAGEAR